ncbi:dihydrouridine synthase domain containing protein [Nitzschia inconspicua]|uniref:tRNA-dihydrouridine synthase n=1 Tax=Nitzschia inconspicua TaxID=303405 RepID=A0A9K3LHE4_9STRA|nr:dihydrouridine synthase domain containing protein [Nitzschia inconspicua]
MENPNNTTEDVAPSSFTRHQRVLDRKWLQKIVKNDVIYATAPMIEQSDTAFRILTRRYGANLCFTPMIHATTFLRKDSYRNKMLHFDRKDSTKEEMDRPLIAQIAGANKETLLECAKLLEPHVDAIDLNLGCPTQTAKRGRYGAYLLGSGPHVVGIVRHLADNSLARDNPCTVVPPYDIEASLKVYNDLVDAGASMLTVHGRTKDMKGEATGKANWDAIRRVVQELGHRVPILANGNLSCWQDVCECLKHTTADGVMSSEGILEYPPALYFPAVCPSTRVLDPGRRPGPGRLAVAREYLELCKTYPPEQGNGASGMQCLQMHVNTFLHADLEGKDCDCLRKMVMSSQTLQDLNRLLEKIEQRHLQLKHGTDSECLSWYYRHFPDGKS